MNLCVIPARGGSKCIKKKNIKNFRERPIIAWSIEKAIASYYLDYLEFIYLFKCSTKYPNFIKLNFNS